jgi:competence protein ComEC
LIAENGTLVGVMTEEGRALSKAKGAGFIAENWLENDGDSSDQPTAHARWAEAQTLGPVQLRHLSGKRAVEGFEGCAPDQIVIASAEMRGRGFDCEVYDPERLRNTGAIAIYLRGDALKLRSVRDVTGSRLWTQWRD